MRGPGNTAVTNRETWVGCRKELLDQIAQQLDILPPRQVARSMGVPGADGHVIAYSDLTHRLSLGGEHLHRHSQKHTKAMLDPSCPCRLLVLDLVRFVTCFAVLRRSSKLWAVWNLPSRKRLDGKGDAHCRQKSHDAAEKGVDLAAKCFVQSIPTKPGLARDGLNILRAHDPFQRLEDLGMVIFVKNIS